MDQHTRDRWLRRVRSVKRQISALYASEILDSELLQDVHRFPCISQWTISELDLSTSHRVFGTQNQIKPWRGLASLRFFTSRVISAVSPSGFRSTSANVSSRSQRVKHSLLIDAEATQIDD